MRFRLRVPATLLTAGALCLPLGCASVMQAIDTSVGAGSRPLDDATVAEGLREALRIGTSRTVDATSRVDGFLANELIRIAVPEKLRRATDAMRRIGLDRMVDDFELGMNRAAERASLEARQQFWDAIRGLTIQDAFAILRGNDDAATQYLRERSETALRGRIRPIVAAKMDEVELSRLYADMVDRIDGLPLVRRPELDLTDYVTEETLDGIFTLLAREEQRIREDPVARTTELLRRVFG